MSSILSRTRIALLAAMVGGHCAIPFPVAAQSPSSPAPPAQPAPAPLPEPTTAASEKQERGWGTPAGEELVHARAQHFYIALPISRCFKGVDVTREYVPPMVGASLMLDLQPAGYIQWQNVDNSFGPTSEVALTNYQSSVLYLSDAIRRARMRAAALTADNKDRAVRYQWALIIIGAITTVLISIKSMSNERTPVYITVGILAIIFSALGTACSSIIAFQNPGDIYARSERALVLLRELHMDLAVEAVSADDPCEPMNRSKPDDSKVKGLKDISSRLTGILNNLSAVGASGQNPPTSSGGPGIGGRSSTAGG